MELHDWELAGFALSAEVRIRTAGFLEGPTKALVGAFAVVWQSYNS